MVGNEKGIIDRSRERQHAPEIVISVPGLSTHSENYEFALTFSAEAVPSEIARNE